MATKRNTLCLADKMKLIEYAKLNPTIGTRKIAEVFKCGRTQVQMILKAKELIISDFETNALPQGSEVVMHNTKTLMVLCMIGIF